MNRIGAVCGSAFLIGISSIQSGCIRPPAGSAPRPLAVFFIPSPFVVPTTESSAESARSVVIDSLSLQPRLASPPAAVGTSVALLTTYQGRRYHPETVRALALDSVVLHRFAGMVSDETGGSSRVILDFQSVAPDDVAELVAVARAIGAAVRKGGERSLSIVVPAQDTVAYPTLILARVADALIVRLDGEHRPGTPPGPAATPDYITRAIGIRSSLIGASRVAVEIPLYGFLWDAGGRARPVTFREAQMLVQRESGVFTRDPATQYLTARGRDGWTLWIPDARTIRSVVDGVRRRGVTTVYLAGPDGADSAVAAELPAAATF
jgi:hypothetical protein